MTGLILSENCVAALGISIHILGATLTYLETRFKELCKLVSTSELFPLLKLSVP